MSEKVPCKECQALILPSTAERTSGLCMACKNGIRKNLEKSKEFYKNQRELDKTCPFRAFWRDLVSRVYDEKLGFHTLTDDEKTYYAVNCLSGEVYNGGLVQYFDNSAGEHYKYAELGLIQIGATNSLRLLREAKAQVFGSDIVPTDRELRQIATDSDAIQKSLDKLDDEFYTDTDELGDRLEKFAFEKGLVKNA
ncbi:DMP19 family protein [Microbulbifer sp. ANSA003]|uniref:DMP19 family protein n=1 Tax=Microbulbifer sp. ANSA003 TaxID=3243360 RepID=UPI0040410165